MQHNPLCRCTCTTVFPEFCPSATIFLTLPGHPMQAESKLCTERVFRRNLLNRLQQEFKNREEMRMRSLQEWVCYVTFFCNIFDYLKVRRYFPFRYFEPSPLSSSSITLNVFYFSPHLLNVTIANTLQRLCHLECIA